MTTFLGQAVYTVHRPPAGAYVDGEWVEGPSSPFSVLASIQPLTGRELEALPEGMRTRGRFKMYTEAVLRTVQECSAGGVKPDLVEAFGRLLEVQTVLDFQNHTTGLPHVKYLLGEPGGDGL